MYYYRKKYKKGFKYFNDKNKEIKNEKLIKELNQIRVTPSYSNVMIFRDNKTKKLIGTGYDAQNRKQYFYDKSHLNKSYKMKYKNLCIYLQQLPRIKRKIQLMLNSKKINKNVLIALTIKIMFLTNFRIGTQRNADEFKTYGISTMLSKHVQIKGRKAIIKFIGKKSMVNEDEINDVKVVNLLKKLKKEKRASKTPLLSCADYTIKAIDVNNFLANFHPSITTKVHRTYAANLLYMEEILKIMRSKGMDIDSKMKRTKISNNIILNISKKMHHTMTMCKTSYLMKELYTMFIQEPMKLKRKIQKCQTPEKALLKSIEVFI